MLCWGNRGFYGSGWSRSIVLGIAGTVGHFLIMGLVASILIVGIFILS